MFGWILGAYVSIYSVVAVGLMKPPICKDTVFERWIRNAQSIQRIFLELHCGGWSSSKKSSSVRCSSRITSTRNTHYYPD